MIVTIYEDKNGNRITEEEYNKWLKHKTMGKSDQFLKKKTKKVKK